jgi:iron complex transport system substrate-binding protein
LTLRFFFAERGFGRRFVPITFSILMFASFNTLYAEERIISLAPHITEVLFAVGAGSEIVGVVEYSDYPESANQIPRIGNSSQLSYEAILAMQPTLVVAWQSGNGQEDIQRLRELGLNVYSHNPHTLEDVADSLRIIGELSGHAEEGADQAEIFLDRLGGLRAKYSNLELVQVYYQLGNEPQMTLNGTHLVSDVIRLCGGKNIFSDAIPLVPRISVESVVRANPEVIIAATVDSQKPEWLDDWLNWPSIQAASNNDLYAVNADFMHRHSSRILDGAEQMCEILEQVRPTP